ncbi:hypothetical protein MITS9509_03498 [Synechococcus sp. MIT S9509]|uniref:hypothetical protein n=1 Tax=Synechococcus sp. MIT S9509 TaxID=1801630 RepID=UPI0007BC1572|nr:hypothetical protein [Synechococcus sp. MIT S9509]KZR86259.1 hypothetical protein MITS9509_03498 [Synechococcus sp. MIT S9509]
MAVFEALKRKPRDSDLHEVFDRASWINAMASPSELWLWLNHRLELASSQIEQEWLSKLIAKVSRSVRAAERSAAARIRRDERDRDRTIRARGRLLSKITVQGWHDVKVAHRREKALIREDEREAKWRSSKEFHELKLQEAEDRWELRKQALIAREEQRRKRDSHGRWLISR